MTQVRWLMWAALAAASAAMVAVVTEALRNGRTPTAAAVARDAEAPQRTPIHATSTTEPSAMLDHDTVPTSVASDDNLPADRTGFGDETLRIRLRGDADGVPVDMRVRLWRLGVPENAEWTAGDQMQTEVRVAANGTRVGHLPPGLYRVQCLDLRDGGADPTAFVLEPGENEQELAVANRRTARLRLLVMDADGSSVRTATRFARSTSGCGESTSDTPAPVWARRRTPKAQTRQQGARTHWWTGSPIGCGPLGTAGVAVDAGADGSFDLGTQVERGRTGYRMWSDDYVRDNGVAVHLAADDKIGVDTTFVGVAPRNDVLVARVTDPDGSKLDPSGAEIDARCDAIRCPWAPPADAWRNVPVRVTVVRDGYEPLKFVWTAATADAEHRLVAAPPKSSK